MSITYYVYVAGQDELTQPIKIGISANPVVRIRRLNTVWIGNKPLKPIYFVSCLTKDQALFIEAATLQRLRQAGVNVRQEIAFCTPDVAVGHLQLTWQRVYKQTCQEIQYELFGETA